MMATLVEKTFTLYEVLFIVYMSTAGLVMLLANHIVRDLLKRKAKVAIEQPSFGTLSAYISIIIMGVVWPYFLYRLVSNMEVSKQ